MPYMAEFVHNNIFDQAYRRHDEPYIKIQLIIVVATPPAPPGIPQPEWWGTDTKEGCEFLYFITDYPVRLLPVPVHNLLPGEVAGIMPG